jgi:hypothetical protein
LRFIEDAPSLKPGRLISIVAGSILVSAHPAAAAHVAVIVVPPFSPAKYADRGAVGLFVPGAGATVTRASALASLVRGKVENAVVGGVPGGQPLIRLVRRPAAVTIYVAVPPPGRRANDRRYPIAIVGGGYRGILTSRSTRIRGLVSIADVAQSAVAVERGRQPVIRSSPEANAADALERLDRTISRRRDVHFGATLILAGSVLGLTLLVLATRSRFAGRTALLAAPASLAGSLVLSGIGVTRPGETLVALAGIAAVASVLGALTERLLPLFLCALPVAYLVVLVAWPEVNSLAPIGPHPDGGGRFFGVTNLVETVLLTVALQAAALLPRAALAPLALLALVTVGWSRAGADGGGLLVLGAAFAVMALRSSGVRLTARAVVACTAAAAAAGAALVGIDAAAGGSSHVTRAAAHPLRAVEELGHRIHISAASFTSSWHAALVIAISVAAIAVLAVRPPRFPAGDALLVGIAISLVVNDSPSDIASGGALSYAVLWAWERVRTRPRREPGVVSLAVGAPRIAPRA